MAPAFANFLKTTEPRSLLFAVLVLLFAARVLHGL
jgi:hypothetical protein